MIITYTNDMGNNDKDTINNPILPLLIINCCCFCRYHCRCNYSDDSFQHNYYHEESCNHYRYNATFTISITIIFLVLFMTIIMIKNGRNHSYFYQNVPLLSSPYFELSSLSLLSSYLAW